jgi:hypothetical protein
VVTALPHAPDVKAQQRWRQQVLEVVEHKNLLVLAPSDNRREEMVVAGCKPNTKPKSGSTQGFTQGLVLEMLRVRFAPADDSKLD